MKKAWLLALTLLGGCGLFWDDPYVTVTQTPLNWLEIHYYNATREPIRRTTVRITGAGTVETLNGTSRLVSDSFAKNFDSANWGDVRSHRYTVSAGHVQNVFQDIVNAGLFDRDKICRKTLHPSNGRLMGVRAAIDNKTYSERVNMFEEDPELAERLYNIVLEFNRPVLGRAKAPAPKKQAP